MAEPLAFLGIFIIVIVIPMLIAWKMPRKQRRYSVKTGQKMSLARRPFSADTKRIVLSAQGHKCNICQCNLMFQGITEFDHKNGDNSDNSSLNCQLFVQIATEEKRMKKIVLGIRDTKY